MGQYWKAVNLEKKEFIHPHRLGSGLKLGEMTYGGQVGAALIILTAAMPQRRGGGDFDMDSNFYGPERTDASEHNMGAPVVEEYNVIAKRTIGRWAGDRIAVIGDYAEDSDLPAEFEASSIYRRCRERDEDDDNDSTETKGDSYTDVTGDVCRVIEHENGGKFMGTGVRDFVTEYEATREIIYLKHQIAHPGPEDDNHTRMWLEGKLKQARTQLAELKGETVVA